MNDESAAHLAAPRRKMQTRSQAKRAWDTDNPGTTYRLDPATIDGIKEIQTWYKNNQHTASLSQIADDLLRHAIHAWHQGDVPITVEPIQSERPRMTKDFPG